MPYDEERGKAFSPLLGPEAEVTDGRDGRDLQRLCLGQMRQNPGQTARQHALARAGRSYHEHAVLAGRRHLQRATGGELPTHIAQVHVRFCSACDEFDGLRRLGKKRLRFEVRANLEQMARRQQDRPLTRRASAALASGTISVCPASRQASAAGKAARTGRRSPPSDSSPMNSSPAQAAAGICPDAARMANAMARS